MKKQLKTYIERIIIDEYVKNNEDFSIYENLPRHEQQIFVDKLFEYDETTRDFLFNRMQELVDQKSSLIHMHRKYEQGFIPCHDNITGEVSWRKIA